MTFGHALKYQVPVVAWIILIFLLSSIPRIPDVRIPISPDKLAHVGVYFVLCLLSRRAFYFQNRFPRLRQNALWAAFGFTLIYGALDEFHQLYVPGRWADIYDVVADGIGGALFVVWFLWRGRRAKPAPGHELT